jgi:cytochrome c oxidase subunit 2
VPGRVHPLTIEADEPGVYRGQCTEFCGLSHAFMRMRVVALTPEDYADWEARQVEGADVPTGELAKEGMELFRTTCSQCHLISGEGGNEAAREEAHIEGAALVAGAAPNLTHFASRGVFAGGVFDLWRDLDGNGEVDIDERGKELNVAALEDWLRDPPGQKPMYPQGSRGMPNLNLTEEQIDALVAYLETLE